MKFSFQKLVSKEITLKYKTHRQMKLFGFKKFHHIHRTSQIKERKNKDAESLTM